MASCSGGGVASATVWRSAQGAPRGHRKMGRSASPRLMPAAPPCAPCTVVGSRTSIQSSQQIPAGNQTSPEPHHGMQTLGGIVRKAAVTAKLLRSPGVTGSSHPAHLQRCMFIAFSSAVLLIPCSAAEAVDVVGFLEQVSSGSTSAGAALFVVSYVGATILLLPASVLTLAAGYLFGPLLGTALVSAGSTLGCSAAFLLSRTLARPMVEARIQDNQKFQAVDKAIASQGPKVVFLLRLSPLFPFNLLNYGLGLSQVDFWPYVGASWLGMLPGTFAYVYLGGLGRATVDAATAGGEGFDTVKLVLYAVGVVATLAVTKVVSSAASKALEDAQKD